MKISSQRLQTSHLSPNEGALLRCQRALELKDSGNYAGAQEVMRPIWRGLGEAPSIEVLHDSVKAEVLVCVGILTCWLAARFRRIDVLEQAKNLISEGISYYESIGDVKQVAAARSELGYCYYLRGELAEARIMFSQALEKLTVEGNTRARAVLGAAVVEWASANLDESRRILSNNSSLFRKISHHGTKAAYHNQVALVFRSLSEPRGDRDCLLKAIDAYKEADFHLKLARNNDFRADLKNNVGFLLFRIGKIKKAHAHLNEARNLAARVKNKVRVAQIDDTRAQVFIAEKKYKEAEATSKAAVKILEKSGHQCLLADALITYGIALARMKQVDRAQYTFQRAIEVAHQVGALNKAGVAALTLIEELDELSADASAAAYDRASEWLAKSQSQELLIRLNAAGRKVVERMRGKMKEEDSTAAIFNKPFDLHSEVLKFEASLIRQALAQSSGSVTRAASLLDMSYQGLAYVIGSRHKDLLKERSPIRRRRSAAGGAEKKDH